MAEVIVRADYLRDLKQYFIKELQTMGYQIEESLTLSDIGITYFNVMKRRIICRPRKILEATDFYCSAEYTEAIAAIRTAVQNGSDLNPYYSKSLKIAQYQDGLGCRSYDSLCDSRGLHDVSVES